MKIYESLKLWTYFAYKFSAHDKLEKVKESDEKHEKVV